MERKASNSRVIRKAVIELHSHSGLENALGFPKSAVLVDYEYFDVFKDKGMTLFKYNGKNYLKVRTIDFVNAGGKFRNFTT